MNDLYFSNKTHTHTHTPIVVFIL